MINSSFIIKGDICYSRDINTLIACEDSYLVSVEGEAKGVYKEIPEEYSNLRVMDYSGKLVIPGLVDLHIHAPQYSFRGLGMDKELLEWLEKYTFPEESKYSDLDYARKAYEIFAEALKKSATTSACIFSTLHVPATLLLMDMIAEAGLRAYVGKVNMDRNSPDYLIEESPEKAAKATAEWVLNCKNHYKKVYPILTPRFIPTCSDELMGYIKEIQKSYELPLQSHLSEAYGEIQWVRELCPGALFYGDAYDRFGLFGREVKTVMAHCVSSSHEELMRIKENGVYIAHCPQSNMNLSSGIAPVRTFIQEGLKVGLGSDVAGGTTESIFTAMADAIHASKLRWALIDKTQEPLTTEEVFYMATKGGGEFFGRVGSFETGYELDAVIIDDSSLRHPQPLTARERLERLIYLSDRCTIIHKFISGEQIF
ncbi:MAG: amidohydrolase family protein [Clostridiaceae bacterium]